MPKALPLREIGKVDLLHLASRAIFPYILLIYEESWNNTCNIHPHFIKF
jgi:hypothetical protein